MQQSKNRQRKTWSVLRAGTAALARRDYDATQARMGCGSADIDVSRLQARDAVRAAGACCRIEDRVLVQSTVRARGESVTKAITVHFDDHERDALEARKKQLGFRSWRTFILELLKHGGAK